jgi:uncharacterized protein YdeI (YjbR/CyaY-like superfamily)
VSDRVEVTSRADWRRWLTAHHEQSGSIWLVTGRKGEANYLTGDDIAEEALCFGWIDSLPRALDARRTMRRVSPRQPGSSWSAVNKARVERLTAAGQMAPAGLAAVAAAKADGSWSRLDAVEALAVPADLDAALAGDPAAAANFAGFPRSAKRAILEWLQAAKRPETRARRIAEIVSEAAQGRRANQWRQPAR